MENNESILNKKLNLVFVYAAILIMGLIIVGIMVSYINSKVSDFTEGYTLNENL